MKNLLFFICLAFAISCSNNDDPTEDNPPYMGYYHGIFDRFGNTENVELFLSDTQFFGESESENFPAICNGNVLVTETTMTFENLCAFPAHFDWTLILDGTWNYNLSADFDSLTLTKLNGDKYILVK